MPCNLVITSLLALMRTTYLHPPDDVAMQELSAQSEVPFAIDTQLYPDTLQST